MTARQAHCKITGIDSQFLKKLNRLLRCAPNELDAYLVNVISHRQISNTKASIHCKFISLDGNQSPRIKDLARKLACRVVDYAIPRSEISNAEKYFKERNSTEKIIELRMKARNLFTDLPQSGEGGEILLYLMAETFLQAPQVLCKMPLKTNPRMHYHGIDGLHANCDPETQKLALFWAESKLHASIGQAMKEALATLANFLIDRGGTDAGSERDLQLLRDNVDFDDPLLQEALLRYLDPDDPMFKKMEYRGICLAGFDSSVYKNKSGPPTEDQIMTEIKRRLDRWLKNTADQIGKLNLSAFHLEIFCLPFPAVDDFREAFRKELQL